MLATMLFTLACQDVNAQKATKHLLSSSQLSNDKSINQFRNVIYNTIYNPEFWSKSFMPSFAVLKVDINEPGHVTDIRFSDSADTLFVKQFEMRNTAWVKEKVLLECYARANSYKGVSIIIPVNYQPNYSIKRSFYYDQMEPFMQFNKKNFNGKAIILDPINIPVLTKGNM